MEENETLIICEGINTIKCKTTCPHAKPHRPRKYEGHRTCTTPMHCRHIDADVGCFEVKK